MQKMTTAIPELQFKARKFDQVVREPKKLDYETTGRIEQTKQPPTNVDESGEAPHNYTVGQKLSMYDNGPRIYPRYNKPFNPGEDTGVSNGSELNEKDINKKKVKEKRGKRLWLWISLIAVLIFIVVLLILKLRR